ncbi:MAG: hypothetical protein ACLP9S_06620 [Syntrophales bacterium]
MRNNMQTRQGEEGYIWPLGVVSLQGTGRQRGERVSKNIAGATGAKIKTGSIGILGCRVHYREDDVIGIAWCDVEF